MFIVPRKGVRLTIRDQAVAVASVLREAAGGRAPPAPLADLLLAQMRFEGNDVINNNNVGNLSAAGFSGGVEVSSWAGAAWRPPWFEPNADGGWNSETYRSLHEQMLAGHEPSAFRAPETLEDGFRQWLSLLVHRYPALLERARVGDVEGFASIYQSSGYCPRCQPAQVAAALRLRMRQQDEARCWQGIELDANSGAGDVGAAVLTVSALVAAVLFWGSTRRVRR